MSLSVKLWWINLEVVWAPSNPAEKQPCDIYFLGQMKQGKLILLNPEENSLGV